MIKIEIERFYEEPQEAVEEAKRLRSYTDRTLIDISGQFMYKRDKVQLTHNPVMNSIEISTVFSRYFWWAKRFKFQRTVIEDGYIVL